MLNPDGQEILKLFHEWAQEYERKIVAIHGMDWGWEDWAQGDLAFYMSEKLGTDNVKREHYYKGTHGLRIDVVVRNDDHERVHVFELKCKSAKADFHDFSKDCEDDYNKLLENHKKSEFKDARAWVVGLYIDQQKMGTNWIHQGYGRVQLFCRTWA